MDQSEYLAAHHLPSDSPHVNLSSLPTDLLFEVAVRGPIRALRCVVRFDARRVACVRLQRSYRLWAHQRQSCVSVGDRVLVRMVSPAVRRLEYATAAASLRAGDIWKVCLLDGTYVNVPWRRIRRLQGWVNGPDAGRVGLSATLVSASRARGAAMLATAEAVVTMQQDPSAPITALAVAAATTAAIAAAAATAASSAVAPMASSDRMGVQEAAGLLTVAHEMRPALHIMRAHYSARDPCTSCTEDVAGDPNGTPAVLLHVASAALEAADEAAAAASAAEAATSATQFAALDTVGALITTASTAATTVEQAVTEWSGHAADGPAPPSSTLAIATAENALAELSNTGLAELLGVRAEGSRAAGSSAVPAATSKWAALGEAPGEVEGVDLLVGLCPMYVRLPLATRLSMERLAEERLRQHNLDSFLAFGDGDEVAAQASVKTPAMEDPDAAWIVHDLLTPVECVSIRRAVDRAALKRGAWQTDRHRLYPTTDLPLSAALDFEPHLREVIFARLIRPLVDFYCGEAALPEHLDLRECFFVKYSARDGEQRELAMHTDGSLFSFNILLSDPLSDFDGGGTSFQGTGWTVRLPIGAALVHSGHVLHGGSPIVRGERYLLVGFVRLMSDPPYSISKSVAAAKDAFCKFGHAAWARFCTQPRPRRLTSSSAEVHHLLAEAGAVVATAATAGLPAEHDAGSSLRALQRDFAAVQIQSAQRGKVGRELASDESMLAEAAEAMATVAILREEAAEEEASRLEAVQTTATRELATARSSLFSSHVMSMPEAARLLLTSVFLPTSRSWETQDEQLALLRVVDHQQADPRPVCHEAYFTSHDIYRLPDAAAPTRVQPIGQSTFGGPCETSVHRFRLEPQLREALLPAVWAAALQQRCDDPEGVRVSNVGGWHSPEQTLDPEATHGAHWYSDLLPTLAAVVSHLQTDESRGAASAASDTSAAHAESGPVISGWLNSSGPCAFNSLHDHGRDVEWSLVLFVATGEVAGEVAGEDTGEDTGKEAEISAPENSAGFGGSLLLKTQLGPVAHGRHGFLPVDPNPGELWAFPGYMKHCVMPRVLEAASPSTTPVQGETAARQRVSAAFNVYSAVSLNALCFVQENMASMREACDRAAYAMKVLHTSLPVTPPPPPSPSASPPRPSPP